MKQDIHFIELLGGCKKVAEHCGITRGAVWQWKKKGIPKAQQNYLALKFPKEHKKAFEEING